MPAGATGGLARVGSLAGLVYFGLRLRMKGQDASGNTFRK